MKKFLFLLALLPVLAMSQKTYTLYPGGDGNVYNPGLASLAKGGDTIVLLASKEYGSVYCGPLRATLVNPIVITNRGGQVHLYAGFNLTGCQGVKLTGSGDPNILLGFRIDPMITDRSKLPGNVCVTMFDDVHSDITIERCSFNNSGFGIWLKNEQTYKGPQDWVIKNVTIQDNEFNNLKAEAIYAGSTNTDGLLRNQGTGTPSRLSNIKILRNSFNGSGRGAIQLALASGDVSEIAYNKIRNAGLELDDRQGNGINLGGYDQVYVHDNDVGTTLGYGLAFYGTFLRGENNQFDSIGYLIPAKPTPWAWAISLETRPTSPLTPLQFTLVGNKIGLRGQGGPSDPGGYDIGVADPVGYAAKGTAYAAGNIVSDNKGASGKALLKVDSWIGYSAPVVAKPPKKLIAVIKVFDDGTVEN